MEILQVEDVYPLMVDEKYYLFDKVELDDNKYYGHEYWWELHIENELAIDPVFLESLQDKKIMTFRFTGKDDMWYTGKGMVTDMEFSDINKMTVSGIGELVKREPIAPASEDEKQFKTGEDLLEYLELEYSLNGDVTPNQIEIVESLIEQRQALDKIRANIHNLGWSMQDASYHGVSEDTIKGVNFAIEKILEGTGITYEEIIKNGK